MPASEESTERSPLLKKGPRTEEGGEPGGLPDGSTDSGESGAQATEDATPELLEARKKVIRMIPVLSMGIFLALLDQTVVAAINGDIGSELNGLHSVSWIATAYFLTMTCCQPLYGKLSDVFGRKPCLLFAYVMFGLGSLWCGLAPSMASLIAGRAVQGIGGSGMMIVVTVLLSDIVSLRDRGTYQGYLNLVGALGTTSGGPLGGLFIQTIGWRWVFLIQAFLCIIAILLVAVFLRVPQVKSSNVSTRTKFTQIDFLGALLLILIVFGILFGLDRGTGVSWRDPVTLVSLCLPLPLIFVFLWVETRFAVEPFTPGHIIFDRNLCACYAQNLFAYAGFTALTYYIPFFFQAALGMTAEQAGISLIPACISAVIGTVAGGFIIKRTRTFYWLAVIASTTAAVGAIPIAVAPSLHRGPQTAIFVGSVTSFVPQGMTITSSLIAIISNVDPKDQAVATACSFLFRSLGAAVGVSLISLVNQSVLNAGLKARLERDEAQHIINGLAQSLEFIKTLRPDLRTVVRECYAKGIQSGFTTSVAMLSVAAFSTLWWREKKMAK